MKNFKITISLFVAVTALFILLQSNNNIRTQSFEKQEVYETSTVHDTSHIKSGHLNISFKAENMCYLPSKKDTHFIYTHIKADTYKPTNTIRIPLNLCLVIDRSGSMSGDRLDYVKKAAEFVVNNLTSDDYLSIVIYDHAVQVLKTPSQIKDKQLFLNIIKGIGIGGSTNLCGGLTEGYNQISKNFKTGYVNRVLLLSDGQANQGIVDPMVINQFSANSNQKNSITTSTFGVGNDFNENLMMSIAESGAGNFYYIGNPDQIPSIFEKELSGLLSVVSQNTKVRINIPKGIKIVQVYGYDNISQSANQIEILLRDISSNDEKAFLFSYVIDSTYNSNIDFVASLTFDDVVNKISNLNTSLKLSIMPSEDEKLISTTMDNEVIAQFAIFHSNYLMSQAMLLVDQSKFKEASQILSSNTYIKSKYSSAIVNNAAYNTQDSLILNYNKNLSNIQTMSEQDKKVMQKSNKSSNYIIKKKR